MAKLHFQGEIPGSKSVFNRALIVQSYFPSLVLKGSSGCDDVRFMRQGLQHLMGSQPIDCGEGGTTFRFMALRVSRIPGRHVLHASKRLLQRPQKGLVDLLNQLGIDVEIKEQEMILNGQGWQPRMQPLRVDTTESSQYASALILNSWLLDFDLEFELVGERLSESYFLLTLEMLRSLGLIVHQTKTRYKIPREQKIDQFSWAIEADMSSAFTMAAAGALAGSVKVDNFFLNSTQPDVAFIEIFKKMQVDFSLSGSCLIVRESPNIRAVDWNLSQSPDLFPVLAVLCSWSQGTSRLFGAPHLVGKESNRIARVSDLLNLVGVEHEVLPDGMIVHGNPKQKLVHQGAFSPDKDHRMVMAAMLMKLKGHQFDLQDPQVINKSFPEFWNMIGMNP